MKKALQNNEQVQVKNPTEGEWFMVNPKTINRELFNEPRKNSKQEWTRQMIIMVLNDPKYCEKTFRTMFPEKVWEKGRTVKQMQEIAETWGGRIAFFAEQVLEWAQRISNGETWEKICNEKDNSKWYRLVLGERNNAILVGACHLFGINVSSTDIIQVKGNSENTLNYVVPLIISYS